MFKALIGDLFSTQAQTQVNTVIIGAGTPLGYVTASGRTVSQGGVAYGTLFNAGYGVYNYNTRSPWSIDYEADHITFNGTGRQAGLGVNDRAGFPYLPSFSIEFSTNLSGALVTASAMTVASNLTGQVYGPVPKAGLASNQSLLYLENSFGGVGLQLAKTNGVLLIIHVITGGPAERAGLPVDTQIVSINGAPVSDMTVNEAAKLLRGDIGTTVKMNVLLPDGTSQDLSLTRVNVGALMHH
jgi:hypothetical protein